MRGSFPKITFGIIVLNGEPFTRYNLRALYAFAHEIIVVEGACKIAAAIATADGHSTDDTLETLYRFKEEEDPENKIQIVTRAGFWDEKDEMSQAYAQRATGDYLWQVDIDEFYKTEDMRTIIEMLQNDPEITAVSFKQLTFWGGFDYIVDGWLFKENSAKYWAQRYHRLFKWKPGYAYVTHRPPTVCDEAGKDLRSIKWINGDSLIKKNIFIYHYSLLLPQQVIEKAKFIAAEQWGEYSKGVIDWAQENYLCTVRKPFQLHNLFQYPSWIKKFTGRHPQYIQQMIQDIKDGKVKVACRNNQDIKTLQSLPLYRILCLLLESFSIFYNYKYFPKKRLSNFLCNIRYDSSTKRIFLK